jgi:hypothetical protein
MAYHLTADREQAMTHFRLAVAAMRSCGDRFHQAESLRRLGAVLVETGAVADGCEALHRAALLLADLGHPDAELVRRELAALTTGARGDPGDAGAGRESAAGADPEAALAGIGAVPGV